MNQKEQMLKAKELIQKRKYQEARKLLVGIDHPTAKKWIDRIDDILFDDPFVGDATGEQQKGADKSDEGKKKQQQQILSGCAILITILSAILIIAVLSDTEEEPTLSDESARISLFTSCAYVVAPDEAGTILDKKRDPDVCEEWAGTTLRQYLKDVRECQQAYNDEFETYVDNEGARMENFETCIIEHGIEYPALP